MDADVRTLTTPELFLRFERRARDWQLARAEIDRLRQELGVALSVHSGAVDALNDVSREWNRRTSVAVALDATAIAEAQTERNVVVRDPDPLTEVRK